MKNINCCKNRDSRKLVVDIAEKIIGISIENKLMKHFIENKNKLELFDTKLFIIQIFKNDNLNFHFEVDLC